jgi:hypothetical protein
MRWEIHLRLSAYDLEFLYDEGFFESVVYNIIVNLLISTCWYHEIVVIKVNNEFLQTDLSKFPCRCAVNTATDKTS